MSGVPKQDPDEIVAAAVAKLPMSASAGCVVTALAGLGAINVSLGIAGGSPVSIVAGVIAIVIAFFMVRVERVNVVRGVVVHAGGAVELEIGKRTEDLFVGDLMELFVASGRGRSQLTLRDGRKLRVASPMDGLDEVAAAVKDRHKAFVTKGI